MTIELAAQVSTGLHSLLPTISSTH